LAETGISARLIYVHRMGSTVASLGLAHWFMIGGALLMMAGSIGLALSRNKGVAEPDPLADEPTAESRQQMLPPLLDSDRKQRDDFSVGDAHAGTAPSRHSGDASG
jgi:hypothetical protein